MPHFDSFTDQQRRHLAHIFAALQNHVKDELQYDREPDFPTLDGKTLHTMWDQVDTALAELMFQAHAEEAAAIEAKGEAYWATLHAAVTRMDAGEAHHG